MEFGRNYQMEMKTNVSDERKKIQPKADYVSLILES